MDQKRVAGIVTTDGELHSRFMIDATGNRHWLARQLGLEIKPYSPRLIAHFGYVEGECPMRDHTPAIVANPEGWTWTAKVLPKLYQWTRLSWENQPIDRDGIPAEFQQLQPQGKINAADVTWRLVPECAGWGYFLVGDAAAVLDPASSHGVLKAIMSGIMAGHAIAKISHHPQTESQAITAYRQWLHHWFQDDITKLRELYSILPKPPRWILAKSAP